MLTAQNSFRSSERLRNADLQSYALSLLVLSNKNQNYGYKVLVLRQRITKINTREIYTKNWENQRKIFIANCALL
jgi:hypothetical protein